MFGCPKETLLLVFDILLSTPKYIFCELSDDETQFFCNEFSPARESATDNFRTTLYSLYKVCYENIIKHNT